MVRGLHRRRRVNISSPERSCWINMIHRCYNPSHAAYNSYGARGIRVCDQWRTDYQQFLKDVGRRPKGDGTRKGEYSIDRIDNNGNYEPNNVRWTTREYQQHNSKRTPYYTINGVRKSLWWWSALFRVNYTAVAARYRKGQNTVEELFRLSSPRKYDEDAKKAMSVAHYNFHLRRKVIEAMTKVERAIDDVIGQYETKETTSEK